MGEHGFHFTAEVDVHERVDDGVGDVLKEVDVEDETTVRHDVERHEECRCECQHEHDSE